MARSSRRLLLLLIANLLASIGGGRVVSAGKGVANLRLLGSGSILAFLTGSALGLALLLLLRRLPLHAALKLVSAASLGNALTCLIVVSRATTGRGLPLRLEGVSAWVFFGFLVLLSALWYAGRSLRSTLAAEGNLNWLALCEAAYFAGFICGLLLGPVSLAGHTGVFGALLLDILLLGAVVACDLRLGATAPPVASAAMAVPSSHGLTDSRSSDLAVARLMLAFACLGVACQVAIFRLADLLARSGQQQPLLWTDGLLAVFYVGIAAVAISAHWLQPRLQRSRNKLVLCLQLARRHVQLSLAWTFVLTGGLVSLVVIGAGRWSASPPTLGGVLLMAALALATASYELLVLAIVGQVGSLDSRSVGVSIGVAATVAALTLFVLGLGCVGRSGLLFTSAIGLGLGFAFLSTACSPTKTD